MAEFKTKLATSAALTITIASLANGSGRASTGVDNSSTNYISADVYLKLKTGASGVSATGYIDVYLVRSEDGTTYDDGFAGSDGAFTPVNATKIGVMVANANATTYYMVLNTALAGDLPREFAIGIVNNTGAALDGTAGSHAATFTGKSVQSV